MSELGDFNMSLHTKIARVSVRIRVRFNGAWGGTAARLPLSNAPDCATFAQTPFAERCLRNHETVTDRLGTRTQTSTPQEHGLTSRAKGSRVHRPARQPSDGFVDVEDA